MNLSRSVFSRHHGGCLVNWQSTRFSYFHVLLTRSRNLWGRRKHQGDFVNTPLPNAKNVIYYNFTFEYVETLQYKAFDNTIYMLRYNISLKRLIRKGKCYAVAFFKMCICLYENPNTKITFSNHTPNQKVSPHQ